jgi:hypothetical protein
MAKKRPVTREGRVWQALDELADALAEFDGDEELREIAEYVDPRKVKSVISQLQAVIGE